MAFLCLTSVTSSIPLTHAWTKRSEPVNVRVCGGKCETQRGKTGMAGDGECFLKEPVGDMVGGGCRRKEVRSL